jgi:hypothetical protein
VAIERCPQLLTTQENIVRWHLGADLRSMPPTSIAHGSAYLLCIVFCLGKLLCSMLLAFCVKSEVLAKANSLWFNVYFATLADIHPDAARLS